MMSDKGFSGMFVRYLAEAIGEDNARIALAGLSEPASVAVRLNPFKSGDVRRTDGTDLADGNVPWSGMASEHFGMPAASVPWNQYGFFLPERPAFTLDPAFHAGCYYVQDSSAMFAGHVFREVIRGMPGPLRVLDLCAAPGGKTTDAAASLRERFGDGFLMVSNEIMKKRASVLADNAGVWGDPCVAVTSADPKAFARLEGWFDVIIADVPCSGEGMFRKDEEAAAQWSEENVSLCQARQRRILADVWPALAPGGVLLYSTCTFNRRENDENVKWAASELGAVPLAAGSDFHGVLKTEMGVLLVPGLVRGEGQYCAAVRKDEACADAGYRRRKSASKPETRRHTSVPEDIAAKAAGWLSCPVKLLIRGDMLVALPENIADELSALDYMHPLMTGTAVGRLKGRDIVPDADMALSLNLRREAFAEHGVDRHTALKFLHGDALTLPDAEKGILLVEYEGHPLGFVKNLGPRCNNLHPQGRRIRMDISI